MHKSSPVVLQRVVKWEVHNVVHHKSNRETYYQQSTLTVVRLYRSVEAEDGPVENSQRDIGSADPDMLELVLELAVVVSISDAHGESGHNGCDESAVEDDAAEDVPVVGSRGVLPVDSS